MGQPGNTLVNHLGVSNYWNKPSAPLNKNSLAWVYFAFLKRIIQILFKYNNVYAKHFFHNNYFSSFSQLLLTLPVAITEYFFYKFYRVGVIKNTRLNLKKTYLIRVGISNIFFFSLKLYLLNEWVLVHFGFFKPKKYILTDFLRLLKVRKPILARYRSMGVPSTYYYYYYVCWKKYWLGISFNNLF